MHTPHRGIIARYYGAAIGHFILWWLPAHFDMTQVTMAPTLTRLPRVLMMAGAACRDTGNRFDMARRRGYLAKYTRMPIRHRRPRRGPGVANAMSEWPSCHIIATSMPRRKCAAFGDVAAIIVCLHTRAPRK